MLPWESLLKTTQTECFLAPRGSWGPTRLQEGSLWKATANLTISACASCPQAGLYSVTLAQSLLPKPRPLVMPILCRTGPSGQGGGRAVLGLFGLQVAVPESLQVTGTPQRRRRWHLSVCRGPSKE